MSHCQACCIVCRASTWPTGVPNVIEDAIYALEHRVRAYVKCWLRCREVMRSSFSAEWKMDEIKKAKQERQIALEELR